ncbi:MAG: DUF3189 family protein, partial [Bacillota bacterium]|nr:DUF3189 family protein [Bacillota bacterium]
DNRIPTREEILKIQYFNTLGYKDMGKILYRGTDDEGNKVFTLGRGTSKVLVPCIENFIRVLHDECGFNDKIVLSNMSPCVPVPMTFGGFFSRGLHIDFIGVPLLVIGARKTFMNIVKVVNSTKEAAKNSKEPVLVLMNSQVKSKGQLDS